jgi:Tol biopolymer transport system component
MRTLAWLVVTFLAPQYAYSAVPVDSVPTVDVGTAKATLARNEALENDPGDRPPVGTQLAFVRDDQIYMVNADGTGLAQLTDTGGGLGNKDPAWSPDGQRLAFARGTSEGGPHGYGTSDIYIMNADGSNVVRLTSGGYNEEPAWGPDGHSIVFTSTPGSSGLSVIDLDADGSQGSRVLLDYTGWDAQPAWSPDGLTITFSSDHMLYDFVFDLYAMNSDGSDVRPLLQGPLLWGNLTYYFQSAWSPDGQTIGVVVCPYAWDNCYPDSAIAVVNADGSGLRIIAQAGSYASPTWSPDGRWLAFGSSPCRKCQSSVRFVQVDGDIEGLIVDNGHSPAWRPETGASINVGHAGAWYNPETPGQGLLIDVDPSEQSIFLAWFTFTDSASATPGEQHWYTAQGRYSGATADLPLYETLGGQFDGPRETSTVSVGRIGLTFSDCNQALFGYEIDADGRDNAMSLQRVIPGSAGVCEQKSTASPGTQSVNIGDGMDGAWVNQNRPGQGFLIDAYPNPDGGNFIFVAWFTYGEGSASGQRWLTAQGAFAGPQADIPVYETTGGRFDDLLSTETHQIGTMAIDFSDCRNAWLSYSLDDNNLEGAEAITRLVPGGQALCE